LIRNISYFIGFLAGEAGAVVGADGVEELEVDVGLGVTTGRLGGETGPRTTLGGYLEGPGIIEYKGTKLTP
jgi:hypothetical protein